jgi:dTDP-glucose pyrophosphorylase
MNTPSGSYQNIPVERLKIDSGADMLSAMKQMDETDYKLLIVCKENTFKSLLSIGDIQRALIKGTALETPVENILRKNVTVCYSSDTEEKIKEQMLKFRTEFMPILNPGGELEKIIFWEEVFQETHTPYLNPLDVPVVIMAGGKGSRLKPLTNIIPKPLIPIGEKPIIEVIVDRFVKMGCKKFYFSVNYKGEMIRAYFDNIPHKNYSVDYFTETKPLGTAGGLSLLNKTEIRTAFFVSNCDVLIEQDYHEIYNYHKTNKNELTIVGALKNYSIPYGTLDFDTHGVLKSIKEKPELNFWVNTGMYILEPGLLEEIPGDVFYHITDLIEMLRSKNRKVGVFPISEGSWIDIGEWKEYYKILGNSIK